MHRLFIFALDRVIFFDGDDEGVVVGVDFGVDFDDDVVGGDVVVVDDAVVVDDIISIAATSLENSLTANCLFSSTISFCSVSSLSLNTSHSSFV